MYECIIILVTLVISTVLIHVLVRIRKGCGLWRERLDMMEWVVVVQGYLLALVHVWQSKRAQEKEVYKSVTLCAREREREGKKWLTAAAEVEDRLA